MPRDGEAYELLGDRQVCRLYIFFLTFLLECFVPVWREGCADRAALKRVFLFEAEQTPSAEPQFTLITGGYSPRIP